MKLTDSIIKNAKPTEVRYQLADGNGLVLYIMPNGTKLWRYRYRYGGKPKMLSLGKYPSVSLKDARAAREHVSGLLKQGIDPSIDKQEAKIKQAAAIKNNFKSVAQAW